MLTRLYPIVYRQLEILEKKAFSREAIALYSTYYGGCFSKEVTAL